MTGPDTFTGRYDDAQNFALAQSDKYPLRRRPWDARSVPEMASAEDGSLKYPHLVRAKLPHVAASGLSPCGRGRRRQQNRREDERGGHDCLRSGPVSARPPRPAADDYNRAPA